MLSLDWAEGSGEANSPYRRAGKLRNTIVAILENTVSQRQSLWTQGGIGLAKNLFRFTLPSYRKTQRNFFGQPNTWKESTLQGPGVLP